jgi:catechol 2,3-dioxygenase-like lactoylglutathione lyase family enzyme
MAHMGTTTQVVLTLHVPSVEEAAAWYQRVLGWMGHFDTFDEAGQCLFGSVMLQENPFVGLNLARSGQAKATDQCDHVSIWIYVSSVSFFL